MLCDGWPLFFPLTVPFPPQVFNIKNLQVLVFQNNPIREIPSHTEVTEEIYSFLQFAITSSFWVR